MVKTLLDEHEYIVSAVKLVDPATALIGKNDNEYIRIARQLIAFFREYGDSYHHQKEENILFPEMNKKNELLGEGVIKEMFENHSDFRDMLQSAEQFLDKKDLMRASQQLHIYAEALLDHIAVENEEVFQMTESLFDDNELQKLYFRFKDNDTAIGMDKKKKLEDEMIELQKAISKI